MSHGRGREMEIRVCPKCDRAFYAPVDGERVLCMHCGYVLFDRRSTVREQRRIDVFFYLKGVRRSARLKDYSSTGAGVEYDGTAIEVDAVIDVDIKELGVHMHAITVWSKKVDDARCASGLKYLQT